MPSNKLGLFILSTAVVSASLVAVPGVGDQAFAAACSAGGVSAFSGGDGSEGDPYLIGSPEELVLLSDQSNSADISAYFELTSDINLAACDWTSIDANNSYVMDLHIDGNGHNISGLKITGSPAYPAFIGVLDSGFVRDISFTEVDINVSVDDVGAVVSRMFGSSSLQRVYVDGSITGSDTVGALVGAYYSTGAVSDSYSTATVTGTAAVDIRTAGLLGQASGNGSELVRSYFAGTVATPNIGTNSREGGLVGTDFFATSFTVTSSFYDSEVAGIADNGLGTPKTTLEMHEIATYDNAGWGIVDSWRAFDDGSPSTAWGLCSEVNGGYPYLLWQYTTDPCASETLTTQPAAANPGIFLTLTTTPGQALEGSRVLFGSYAVTPNSVYELVVTSRSNPLGGATTLASSSVGSRGHLETNLQLPKLSAGGYKLVFAVTSETGSRLQLVNHFEVDSGGALASKSPEALQPVLN